MRQAGIVDLEADLAPAAARLARRQRAQLLMGTVASMHEGERSQAQSRVAIADPIAVVSGPTRARASST